MRSGRAVGEARQVEGTVVRMQVGSNWSEIGTATHTAWTVPAASLCLLVGLTGCATSSSGGSATGVSKPTASASKPSASAGQGVVRMKSTLIGGESRFDLEQIVDFIHKRSRTTYLGGSDGVVAGRRIVWDGTALLDYQPGSPATYTRTEKAKLRPEMIPSFDFRPESKSFQASCSKARRLGNGKMLGRSTIRYACAETTTSQGLRMPPHEIWVDEQTGLQLKDIGQGFTDTVTEFTVNPPIDPETFSTEVPPGASPRPLRSG